MKYCFCLSFNKGEYFSSILDYNFKVPSPYQGEGQGEVIKLPALE